jgi:hypothetical protein
MPAPYDVPWRPLSHVCRAGGMIVKRRVPSSPSSTPFLPSPCIAAALILSILADGLLLRSAGLGVAATPALAIFALWAIAAIVLGFVLRAPAGSAARFARDLVEGISLFALVSLLGAVASYPLAAGQHPLVDAELEHLDGDLHFHWLRWYAWIADHAWLQAVERMAYLSIFVTPALLIGYFAATGRRAESRLFIATFWVAVVITLALFPLFPAAGPFATLWHGSVPYMPLSALYQEQVIEALRHHLIRSIDLGQLHGLVCAPSFHAASAVIYIVTAFRIPALRWPIAALNIVMLIATPVEGTHYLTDLLSGMAVACVALGLTPALVRWTARGEAGWRGGLRDMAPVAAE